MGIPTARCRRILLSVLHRRPQVAAAMQDAQQFPVQSSRDTEETYGNR